MTSLQAKFLLISGLYLAVKIGFAIFIYSKTKRIEKRAKALEAFEEQNSLVNPPDN